MLTIHFSKEIASVSESKYVAAAIQGNKVVFTQLMDSPAEDTKLDFVVTAAGGAESMHVGITLARRERAESPEVAVDLVLEHDSVEFTLKGSRTTKKHVRVLAGKAVLDSVPEGMAVDVQRDKVFVLVPNTTLAGDYWVKFKPLQPGKEGVKLKVSVTVEPFALENEGQFTAKLGADTDAVVWVKAKSGSIVNVVTPSPANAKVAWKFHKDQKAVAITVARDATVKDIKEYAIRLTGKDGAGKTARAEVTFKLVPAVEPFVLENSAGKLDLKLTGNADRDLVSLVKARSGTIVDVEPSPADARVSWKFVPETKAIAITVSRDAGLAEVKDYLIRARGRDGAGLPARAELKFKVSAEPFRLEDDGKLEIMVNPEKDAVVWVKARSGTILGVSGSPTDCKVDWKYLPEKKAIAITVSKDASGADIKEYAIVVKGKGVAGNTTRVELKFKVRVEPFTLDGDGKIEVKLGANGKKPVELSVKAKSGRILHVSPPPQNSKVTWSHDAEKNAITFNISGDAGVEEAREYLISVRGTDFAGKLARVDLTLRVSVPGSVVEKRPGSQ